MMQCSFKANESLLMVCPIDIKEIHSLSLDDILEAKCSEFSLICYSLMQASETLVSHSQALNH